jgi:hypothetical protein
MKLGGLIDATANAARESGEIAKSLREIGTPELMRSLAATRADIDNLARSSLEQLDAQGERVKALSSQSSRFAAESSSTLLKLTRLGAVLIALSVTTLVASALSIFLSR